jgi:hypothetical protein
MIVFDLKVISFEYLHEISTCLHSLCLGLRVEIVFCCS